jgi:putative ABC transport system permease protein
MSVKVGAIVARLPHVALVSPVVWQANTSGTFEIISGIDLDSYDHLGVPFRYLEGGPFTGPDQMLIDDYIATQNHLHVGDTQNLLNHDVKVVGIVEHGKGARKFLPITTLQDWIGAQGKASVLYLKVDDPANTDAVIQEIQNYPGLQGYTVRSVEQYMTMMTSGNISGLRTFIAVVIGVSVVIGFIVIFQAMYTAVMERTREIGILKSLGATKLYIMLLIFRETFLLAVVGVLLGYAISFATRSGLHAKFPLLPILILPNWLAYAAGIAIVGAILGALYPAFKAAQKDPIESLAYE